MRKNRVLFIGLWVLFTSLLIVFPGYEGRSLLFGLIIGTWPLIILSWLGINTHFILSLIIIFIFVVAYIVLLPWLIDKLKIFTPFHIMLPVTCIILSSIIISSKAPSYETWKRSFITHVESSKGKDLATRKVYQREILIPLALAGGQVGVYISIFACTILSVFIYQKRKRKIPESRL